MQKRTTRTNLAPKEKVGAQLQRIKSLTKPTHNHPQPSFYTSFNSLNTKGFVLVTRMDSATQFHLAQFLLNTNLYPRLYLDPGANVARIKLKESRRNDNDANNRLDD